MAKVSFYPYATLSSTIRLRDQQPVVRISDILKDAPAPVLEALLVTLVARLFGRRPPRKASLIYRDYVTRPDVKSLARTARRRRGRKQMKGPEGEVHDLRRIFDKLNHDHFSGGLRVDRLGWSLRRSRSRLGHYDPAHQAIVIDRRLDNPLVPEYVVAYVVFHEMLHAHFGEEERGDFRRVHHRRFRASERTYPDYQKATQFIREHFG